MWLPLLVEQLNYSDLQAAGFKLSAEDIYSINQASLKDAIVLFGRGCTGGIVSGKGLLFTNHHCGAGYITSHSSVDLNYLVNGFWAMKPEEEIPNPGLTVKFLVKMIDVTDSVLKGISPGLSYTDEQAVLDQKISKFESAIEDTSDYLAVVESFYSGNNYYLFLYSEYSDVRLVGAPPESIASFGGETDNWVWPRHSADFSVFRIYTAPDGKPANYSTENVPLETKQFLPISLRGVNQGDLTLVLGFPGRTSEYLYSGELENLKNNIYPLRIKLRAGRLNIINKARNADENVYLKYASEQSGISNPYKKWVGVLYGFQRFDVFEKRTEYEKFLISTAGSKKVELQEMYDMFEDTYSAYKPYAFTVDYFNESVFSVKPLNFCSDISAILKSSHENPAQIEERLMATGKKYFKNFDRETDKALTMFLLQNFRNDIDEMYLPATLKEIESDDDLNKFLDKLYSKSVFTDSVRYNMAVKTVLSGKNKVFLNDQMMRLYSEFRIIFSSELLSEYNYYKAQYESIYRDYIPLIQSIDTSRMFYPDANLTMRLTYGFVSGYSPSDAVEYNYQTFIDGLFQKKAQGIGEYKVPARFEKLYNQKNFGIYADSLGRLPLCFIASNHTSGGNSGSPVMDCEGKMIGLNFDRTWESTMSDFYFDESICRNIAIDSKYILFIIDKYAGAGYLLDEMKIER
jgi:hypothetical protein